MRPIRCALLRMQKHNRVTIYAFKNDQKFSGVDSVKDLIPVLIEAAQCLEEENEEEKDDCLSEK